MTWTISPKINLFWETCVAAAAREGFLERLRFWGDSPQGSQVACHAASVLACQLVLTGVASLVRFQFWVSSRSHPKKNKVTGLLTWVKRVGKFLSMECVALWGHPCCFHFSLWGAHTLMIRCKRLPLWLVKKRLLHLLCYFSYNTIIFHPTQRHLLLCMPHLEFNSHVIVCIFPVFYPVDLWDGVGGVIDARLFLPRGVIPCLVLMNVLAVQHLYYVI